MSRKLLIIVAVQSALVLGLGGVALGVSMQGSEPAPTHAKKKKAPPPEEEVASEEPADEAPAEEPVAPKKKVKKVAHAEVEADAEAEPAPAKHDDKKAHDEPAKGHEAKPEKAAKDHDEPAKGHESKPEKVAKAHDDEPAQELSPIHEVPADPLQVFAWLDEGNTRWTAGVARTRDVVAWRAAAAKKFEPWAMVVACSDGRVVPEAVFDTGPGTLVTLRAPVLKPEPAMLANVELGLRRGSPRVVVVLGHDGCDDGSGRAVEEQVTQFTAKLLGRKPVRERLKSNQLLVLRALYDLESGHVRWLDSEEGKHDKSAAVVH